MAPVTHEAAQAFLTRRKLNHPEAIGRFKIGFANRTPGYRLPPSQLNAFKPISYEELAEGFVMIIGPPAHQTWSDWASLTPIVEPPSWTR